MKKIVLLFWGLCCTMLLNAQVSKSVVCTAGGLSSQLTQQDYYTLTNLTISGIMDARDFNTIKMQLSQTLKVLDISAVTIVQYSGTEGTYGSNLTYQANTIPTYCFSMNKIISNIILPSSITSIGTNAFINCENITSITIPSLVTNIGEGAFASCSGLQYISMPSTISTIDKGAFGFCTNLTSINLPSLVTTISTGLFQGCTKLSNYIIPSTITSIGDFAFASCSGLKTISIPETVTKIGYSAFSDCSSLQSIAIPSYVTKLDSYLFKNCSTLTSIVVPPSVNSIGEEVFFGCKAAISLPATTIDWHYSAFRGTSGPISVNANSTIFSSVNGVLFQKIKGILIRFPSSKTGSYIIPSNVYSLNSYAFEDCSGLTSLTIPSSVSEIDSYSSGLVFANCTGLTSLITFAPIPVISQFSTNNFDNIDKTKCTLYVPFGSKTAYQAAAQWKDFINIEEFKTSIVNTAGSLSTKIKAEVRNSFTNLTISGTIDARDFKTIRDSLPNLAVVDLSTANIVTYTGTLGTAGTGNLSYAENTVPESAFYNRTNFTSISLPATATKVDTRAFYNCTKLTSIPTTNAITSIGEWAYSNCTTASSINLSTSLQSIGDYAFYNCTGAKTITIPSTVTTIGNQTFTACKSVTSVSIPGSVTTIGSSAFSACDSLVSATLLSPMSKVGMNMFSSCYKLQSVTLPNTIKEIGSSAFSYCNSLTTLTIPSSVVSIGYSAFYNCSNLISMTIPPSVTSIGTAVFSGCTTISTMIIPSSLTSIPDNLFWGCTNLQSVSLPASITSIGNIAFYNCTSLNSIYSYSETPVDLSASTTVFYNVNKNTCILYISFGSKSKYQNAVQWQDFLNKTEYLNGFGLASTSISISNAEGSSNTVVLTGNVSWSASSNQTWLHVSPASGTNSALLTFTASKNIGQSRTAIVTIKSTGLSDQTIMVTQIPALFLDTTSVSLASTAGSKASKDITSTVSWTASSNKSWLTVNPTTGSSNATVDLTALYNGGGIRTAIVTIKASGFPDQTVTVTQESGLPPITLYPNIYGTNVPVVDQQSSKIICDLTMKYIRFKPLISGTYTFSAVSTIDPEITLFDKTFTSLISTDYSNFEFSYDLVAGSFYYLGIKNFTGNNKIITLNITGGPLQGFIFTGSYNNSWNSTYNWNWGTLPAAYNNVYIDGTVIIDQNISVTNLTVSPYSNVTINNGLSINYSNLVLESNASGTASFISDISGLQATTELFLGSQRNWYISSPVSSATSEVLKTPLTNKLWYNIESTQTWKEITDATTPLQVMTGYVANVLDYGNFSFNGNLNTGTQSITLSRTGTSNSKRGFNLVGNPYPSSVNWEMATKSNLEPSIWYRTKNKSYAYVFDTYNADSHVGTNNNGYEAVTQFIPAMQAVWVRVSTDGANGQLTFNNSMRCHPISNFDQLKDDVIEKNIRLCISNEKNSDETIIVFNENAKNSFDRFDSPKMFVNNAEIPELYTTADSEKLVINGMKPIKTNSIIPLGFRTDRVGTFTLNAKEINGLEGVPVILEDKLLHKTQDLTQTASYTFTSDSVDNSDRFILRLKANAEITDINDVSKSTITIAVQNKSIVVTTSETAGTINVYDLLGRVVETKAIEGTKTVIESSAGVYFVKIKTATNIETKKIILE